MLAHILPPHSCAVVWCCLFARWAGLLDWRGESVAGSQVASTESAHTSECFSFLARRPTQKAKRSEEERQRQRQRRRRRQEQMQKQQRLTKLEERGKAIVGSVHSLLPQKSLAFVCRTFSSGNSYQARIYSAQQLPRSRLVFSVFVRSSAIFASHFCRQPAATAKPERTGAPRYFDTAHNSQMQQDGRNWRISRQEMSKQYY